ncbi:MAG: glycosyltransferase family 4 protein [Hyphomicrobiales bacterium]
MSHTFRILHCLRAPVGGLFRHVCDLAEQQRARGHDVGVVCDSLTGDAASSPRLRRLRDIANLGVTQLPMSRFPGPRDVFTARAVRRLAQSLRAGILHGHGAKGGAFARLAGKKLNARSKVVGVFYTPHGGSLHYGPATLQGRVFLGLERKLARHTSGLIFESNYSQGLFRERVMNPPCEVRVIPNGLRPEEFYETHTAANAADFLFVGELRKLKGCDVMLEALSGIARQRPVSACMVGAGPDAAWFRRMARKLKLDAAVSFPGALPAAAAFTRGRCLVVPSRAESFPYIVLEAAAARLPLIATGVGGIPEITEGSGMQLLPPGHVQALSSRMEAFLNSPEPFVEQAAVLQGLVAERFTAAGMADAVLDFYESAGPAAHDPA